MTHILSPTSASQNSDFVTSIWDATGCLTTEDSAKFPAGGIQYTFHLERLPERLPPTEPSNSLSLLELWGEIQLSHGRTPVLPFVPRRPKHIDNFPELLNDAQQEPKKCDDNESQSSVCYSNANGATSQPMRSNSLKQLEKLSLFSSQWAPSESPLEGWTRQLEARLASAPNPSSQYCIPWASVPAGLVGYDRSLSYLPSHHIMLPPPPVFVSPPQGNSIAPGEQQRRGRRPMGRQHQYKTSKKREEKETLDVVEWEQFEQKWKEVMHEYCDSPMLLSRRLQPLEVRRLFHVLRLTILFLNNFL